VINGKLGIVYLRSSASLARSYNQESERRLRSLEGPTALARPEFAFTVAIPA
jgi:hypothetical protein